MFDFSVAQHAMRWFLPGGGGAAAAAPGVCSNAQLIRILLEMRNNWLIEVKRVFTLACHHPGKILNVAAVDDTNQHDFSLGAGRATVDDVSDTAPVVLVPTSV